MLTKGKMHLVTKNDRLKFCIIFVEDVQVSWLNCHLHRLDLVETWSESTDCVLQSGSSVVFGWFSNKIVYFKIPQIYEMSSISAYMIWVTDSDIYRNDIDQLGPTNSFKMLSQTYGWKEWSVYWFFIILFIGSKTGYHNPILFSCAWWI